MSRNDLPIDRAKAAHDLIVAALDMIERVEDPAPSPVDLIEVALLLDTALGVLAPAANLDNSPFH